VISLNTNQLGHCEGLEARLPHLLRGRHQQELLLIINVKNFINREI